MSNISTIEWTDATWNPARGCRKISLGCMHCYADTFAERFRGVKGNAYELGFTPRLAPSMLAEPLRWAKPRLVFVNSMSDLFLDEIPDGYIRDVARVMRKANWHTFQVLTKQADRMVQMLAGPLARAASKRHIWWGVSIEDRKYGLPRIDLLRAAPAAMRFLSIEPLLEDLGKLDLTDIDWVIVGGESGPGARPMKRRWVRSVREQCEDAGVPFFFKQWGGVNKKAAGRELDGRTHDTMPTRPSVEVPTRDVRLDLIDRAERKAARWPTEPLAQIRLRPRRDDR